MRIARHVVDRSKQLLVPVPAQVRDHLGLVGTAEVWWHIGKKGEVALTVSGRRSTGPMPPGASCPSCAKYREKVAKLQRKAAEAPAKALRRFRMHEWMSRLRVELRGLPELTVMNQRMARLEDRLGVRRGPWRYRAKRGMPAPAPLRRADPMPPPDPSLVPAVVDGGADTSGAAPPGVPA